MRSNYYQFATYLWMLIGVLWLVGMIYAKPTVRSQSWGSRIFEMSLSLLAFVMAFTGTFAHGWLGKQVLSPSNATGIGGLTLTFFGVALAVWSRFQLGSNWSASVTVKADHSLIRRGPYTIVRHPMYTGFLLALLGVAVIVGQMRGFFGVAVLFLALLLKSSVEESFMLQQFGAEYRQYQGRVKALIPFVF